MSSKSWNEKPGAMPTLVVGMSCFPVFTHMPTTSVDMAPKTWAWHPAFRASQESGHVPVGQLDLVDPEDPLFPTANAERILSVFVEPHCSHLCFTLVSAFSKNSVTCPHSLQRYSNNGMTFSSLC